MPIGQMRELGAVVRAERHRRGLSQVELAAQAGVSREWLGRLENGAPRLEADKVLSVLRVLDFSLLAKDEQPTQADIAKAKKVAWTMGLEARPLSDDGSSACFARSSHIGSLVRRRDRPRRIG